MDMIQRGYLIVDAKRGHDDTAERESYSRPFQTMKAAFSKVENNDTVLVYPGTYTENPIDDPNWWNLPWAGAAFGLYDRHNVTIQGVGRPEIHFTCHANGMVFISCTNCKMAGFRVSGMGYMRKGPGRYYALILLHGTNRGHQFDDIIGQDSGDHILAHLAGPRTVFDTKVTNCKFYRCGQMIPGSPWPDGVAVGLGGYGNTIAGNYFEECNRCVEVESGDFPNDNTEAINISIVDNKIYHPWAHPILITPLRPRFVYGKMIISRNHIQGWGHDPKPDFGGRWAPNGIWITGTQSAVITENVISDLWDAIAIQVQSAGGPIRNVVIANNILTNIGRTGVSLTVEDYKKQGVLPENFPVEYCQIHHNQINDCQGRAIWLSGDYNLVESNVIVDSDYAGLYELSGVGNMWRGNRLIDCGGAAVAGHPPDASVMLLNAGQEELNEVFYVKKTPPVIGNGSN